MAGELSPADWSLIERVCPTRSEQSVARLYPEILARLLSAARADGPGGGVVEVLRDLAALVRGECPSLLNEDSGGDAALDQRIDEALSPVMVEGGLGTSSANGAATGGPAPAAITAEQAGWRPIETLEPTGSAVLLSSPEWEGGTVREWPTRWHMERDLRNWIDPPTHWQPINPPAPPASVISPPTAADAMSAPDTKPQSPQTGEEAER